MYGSQGISLDIPSRNQLEDGIKVMHDRGIKVDRKEVFFERLTRYG